MKTDIADHYTGTSFFQSGRRGGGYSRLKFTLTFATLGPGHTYICTYIHTYTHTVYTYVLDIVFSAFGLIPQFQHNHVYEHEIQQMFSDHRNLRTKLNTTVQLQYVKSFFMKIV
jgi:hypothetical protein